MTLKFQRNSFIACRNLSVDKEYYNYLQEHAFRRPGELGDISVCRTFRKPGEHGDISVRVLYVHLKNVLFN